ncbi:MAG: hypothetical protein R3195_09235 [Gemmatimonadota bacterium]|nr:hypothetical protein [Gemmatimonadota bacterium]
MEIRHDRMVHLGYAKYWRSDEILGLVRIEEERGPGRRTAVYVSTLEEPIIASRSEGSILQDMASMPDEARAAEIGSIAEDLIGAMREIPPVIRRMLKNEGGFDAEYWVRRLRGVIEKGDDSETQEDLFG